MATAWVSYSLSDEQMTTCLVPLAAKASAAEAASIASLLGTAMPAISKKFFANADRAACAASGPTLSSKTVGRAPFAADASLRSRSASKGAE